MPDMLNARRVMPGVRSNPYSVTRMHEEGYISVCNFSDSLAIHVMPAPVSTGDQDIPSSRRLGLIFDSRDKEALFFQVLGVFDPVAAVGGRITAEDFRQGKWNELMARFEQSVEQATAKLPMLRRLKEEYQDAVYAPEVIDDFREECIRIRSNTDDLRALASLEILIQACDEALKERSGLFFASD